MPLQRIVLCIFFVLLVNGISATRRNYKQTSRLLMRTPQEYVGSVLLQKRFGQENIVASDFLPNRPLFTGEVYLKYNTQDSSITSIISPTERQAYGVKFAFENVKDTRTLWGGGDGGYFSLGVLRWHKGLYTDYFAPYWVLDTTVSNSHGMQGSVYLGHLWRNRQWTFGVEGKAHGVYHRALAEGLSHKTRELDIRIREGVYLWLDDYWLGQWGSFEYQWQNLRVSNEGKAVYLFRHLGFGLWDVQRSFAANPLFVRSTTGQVGIGVQVAARESGVVAALHGAHRWGNIADTGRLVVGAIERQQLSLAVGYKYLWDEMQYEALAHLHIDNRTGVEQIYDSVGRKGMKRYELLFSSPTFFDNRKLAGGSLAAEIPIAEYKLSTKIGIFFGKFLQRYKNPKKKYSLSYWKLNLECGVLRKWLYSWGAVCLVGEFRRAKRGEFELSQAIKEPLYSSFFLPELLRREAGYLSLHLKGEFGYRYKKGLALVVEPQMGMYWLPTLGGEWGGSLTIRVQKE